MLIHVDEGLAGGERQQRQGQQQNGGKRWHVEDAALQSRIGDYAQAGGRAGGSDTDVAETCSELFQVQRDINEE
jgi:hypothetical protein